MLTSKTIKETIENLFQFDLDKSYNYLWCCYEKTPLPLLSLFKGQGAMPPLSVVPAYRYQQPLPRSITCQDACVQHSHAAKRLISQLEVNTRRFVAMLLLHSRDQQWNTSVTSLATCLCRQKSGHEWTASSPLHDTRTVNLALVQC